MSDAEHVTGSPPTRRAAWTWAAAVAIAVVAVDQIAKQIAVSSIDPGESRDFLLGIEFANVRNRGVAFGLMSGGAAPLVAFTVVAVGALSLYFSRNEQRRYLWLVVGLLGGGAIANLTDRLRVGAVIDFIDLPAWPTFNVADMAIVFGAGGLALLLMSAGEQDGN